MNILSFNVDSSHDSAAAIVCDGKLVAAAEEERFSRRKHDGSFPAGAIRFCLTEAGLSMSDIDVVAIPELQYQWGGGSIVSDTEGDILREARRKRQIGLRTVVHKSLVVTANALSSTPPGLRPFAHVNSARTALREHFGHAPPFRFVDHHRSHAAGALLTSEYRTATVLTIDGVGGGYSTVIWEARDGRLRRRAAELYPNSLGLFYSACAEFAGMGEHGEGKFMGLAAYGDANVLADRVAQMCVDTESGYHIAAFPSSSNLKFGPASAPTREPAFADFAAAVQARLVATVVRLTSMHGDVGMPLCLGGGVALNCSCNGALHARRDDGGPWVFPAAGDGGLPVGSALFIAHDAGEFQAQKLASAYLGPDVSPESCERALANEQGLRVTRPERVADCAARLIADGYVVGWCRGRMEIGPRALGHRSIFADPRSELIRDRVNHLKRREAWRPLAPMVLEERASEYFTLRGPSRFMLLAVQATELARATIPGVVHVDGSARPQTVNAEQEPDLAALLHQFAIQSGVPVLLNTSFNAAGEPIVCTAEDAVRAFQSMSLDALVLGPYLVTRET